MLPVGFILQIPNDYRQIPHNPENVELSPFSNNVYFLVVC